MELQIDIVKISPLESENIDFNAYIFKFILDQALDINSSIDFSVLFKMAIAGGALKLIIDMKTVESVDSSGIASLITAAKLLHPKQGRIAIININSDIIALFRTINIHKLVHLCTNEGEAFNYLRFI
jgi:anti-anti-sigma factor